LNVQRAQGVRRTFVSSNRLIVLAATGFDRNLFLPAAVRVDPDSTRVADAPSPISSTRRRRGNSKGEALVPTPARMLFSIDAAGPG
jgi:hypothetical protein